MLVVAVAATDLLGQLVEGVLDGPPEVELLEEGHVVALLELGQLRHGQEVGLDSGAQVAGWHLGPEEPAPFGQVRSPVVEDRPDESRLGLEVVLHRRLVGDTSRLQDLADRHPVDAMLAKSRSAVVTRVSLVDGAVPIEEPDITMA